MSPQLVQTEETNLLLLQESFLPSTGETTRCSTTRYATDEHFNHSSTLPAFSPALPKLFLVYCLTGPTKTVPGVLSHRPYQNCSWCTVSPALPKLLLVYFLSAKRDARRLTSIFSGPKKYFPKEGGFHFFV